jgi:hypothetical protein
MLERQESSQGASSQAFASAEAGLEYYRWHLARFPSDLVAGPGAHTVLGATTTPLGTFSLSTAVNVQCGTTTSVAITSKGISADGTATQTLFARYATPTFGGDSYATAPAFDPSRELALLPTLETYAKQSGIYLASSGGYGYKIVFNPDGSLTAYPVTAVEQVWGYSSQNGWQKENSVIASLGSGITYALPGSCPLVFVDDTAWVEGTVSGRATLVATNVFLSNNVTYENASGDTLAVIGRGSVLVSLQGPDIMKLDGVYVALGGMFGRNEYLASGAHAVPSDLASYATRTSLSVVGSVVSDASSTVRWNDGNGNFLSGYSQDSFVVDGSLVKNPPPFVPVSTTTPRFISWREQR